MTTPIRTHRPVHVLSLFDGMSCGRCALGPDIPLVYYSSEVCPDALSIAAKNHPSNIPLGDVRFWRGWDVDLSRIDLVLCGSPCQDISRAGKGAGLEDGERSSLFFVACEILEEVKKKNPDVEFLFENVVPSKADLEVMSNTLGVQPVRVNSSLVSAQMRDRLYWSNFHFEPPEDKGVVLQDILEPGYYATRDKSYCIDANYGKGTNFRRFFFCGSRTLVLEDGYTPGCMTKETANEVMHEEGNRWRKLTPLEVERLQTLPEGYTEGVSDGKRYKMLGNGWTVDVVKHILSQSNTIKGFRE